MELFNSHYKEQFISKYPPKSKVTYKSVFERSSVYEHELQKDLSDFDLHDIEQVFKKLSLNYISTARSYGRIITAYIDWAIEHSVRSDTTNPLKQVNTTWFEQFVNKSAKIFFTEKEIKKIEDSCENAQDAVIIRLLFEGAQGKAASELRNLKRSDVNFEESELLLQDEDGSRRILKVSPDCLRLVKEAISEATYTKSNGQMKERENIRNFTDLVDNDFVIRSSNTGKEKSIGAVDKYVVYRRISMIEKTFGLDHLNIKNISRSGMLYRARELMVDYNMPLNLIMLIEIAEMFKVNSYNTLRSFITEDIIENLYEKE